MARRKGGVPRAKGGMLKPHVKRIGGQVKRGEISPHEAKQAIVRISPHMHAMQPTAGHHNHIGKIGHSGIVGTSVKRLGTKKTAKITGLKIAKKGHRAVI